MAKDPFRAKPITKYTPKSLVAQIERADDQIAPTAAARSIDALQRWALLTANIVQGRPRANEMQTIERIQNRYMNDGSPRVLASSTKGIMAAESSDVEIDIAAVKKRKHSVSPKRSLAMGTVYAKDTDKADLRHTKRSRPKPADISSVNGDYESTQSGERSVFSKDGVKVERKVKATKTRTYTGVV